VTVPWTLAFLRFDKANKYVDAVLRLHGFPLSAVERTSFSGVRKKHHGGSDTLGLRMHVHPFFALRAAANRVSQVACPPYDVVDFAGAVACAANPNSFMRVVRPEVDFGPDQDPHSPSVYARGLDNLRGLLERRCMVREPRENFYVYRQAAQGRTQSGLVCCVDVADYVSGIIARHELTRPDKEQDRTDHMITLRAHCEPVFLTVAGLNGFVAQLSRDMNHRPLFHFSAPDKVIHTLWAATSIDAYRQLFADVPRVFIADGHHRSAAAARASDALAHVTDDIDRNEVGRFPAVIYPAEELLILPYHRLARLASGQRAEQLERALNEVAVLEMVDESEGPAPRAKGEVSVYLNKSWWRLRLPRAHGESPTDLLDVVRLSRTVLAPILGITDERTDPRLSFLGGCSAQELAAHVENGKADIAFAMYPTSIEELLAVAGAGLIMPPKSTWFHPKIRSGLFLHSFSPALDAALG